MKLTLNPQYVIDNQHNTKGVLLSIEEWEQLMEALEELDDIRAYDLAKTGSQDAVSFGQVVQELREKDI
jgi:PHD/YefM family antitoxin component YafN of YafNO toxin-antitoxin module